MPVSINPHEFISHVIGTEEPHPYKPKGAAPTPTPNHYSVISCSGIMPQFMVSEERKDELKTKGCATRLGATPSK